MLTCVLLILVFRELEDARNELDGKAKHDSKVLIGAGV